MTQTQQVGSWFTSGTTLDWFALALFVAAVAGYRIFLAAMLKNRPDRLYLGKLQAYRNAWIESHSGDRNSILVVQTLRNMIMAASFLASTSIILIMGAINLSDNIEMFGGKVHVLMFEFQSPTISLLKVLLIIASLSYSFFNFMTYIREVNYMSFILNIPKPQLDDIEGGDSSKLIAKIFLSSGIHFSMGMRGFYFLIPLFLWIFHPILMMVSTILFVAVLVKRDLAR